MPRGTGEELRVLARRTKVASCLLRGITNQFEITRQLGMDEGQRTTISRDIAAIRLEWQQSALRDFDEAKGRELEKLELLEREAWEAWERSKTEKESSKHRREYGKRPAPPASPAPGEPLAPNPPPAPEPEPESTLDEKVKEKRDGNPAFLEAVLKCINKRCAILGLNAPEKIAPTNPQGDKPYSWDIPLRELTDEELTVMEKLAQRMRTAAEGKTNDN